MENYNLPYFEQLKLDFASDKFILIFPNESKLMIGIQNGPIKDHGENGTQIDSLGKIWLNLIEQFNAKFPCDENEHTIRHIKEALHWQARRTTNRAVRGVEGRNVL